MTKQEFWNSFERHMPALEKLISDSTQDYAAYNALSSDLSAYDKYLIPEITGDGESGYILIISCDGYRQGIPAAEELVKDLKDFPNWKVVKYRQPGPMGYIPINGKKVYRNDILLTWEKLPNGQYFLSFYLKWYANNQTQQTCAILHLDHTIGEHDAMTRIKNVEFKSLWPFRSKKDLKTYDELKTDIDNNLMVRNEVN